MTDRVQISIPAGRTFETPTVHCLCGLVQHSIEQGVRLEVLIAESSSIAVNRAELADRALSGGVDAVLWLDTDMTFPPDTLVRLLAHGRKFVAAACATRSGPVRATAVPLEGPFDPSRTGLEEVRFVGLGVALERVTALRKAMTVGNPSVLGLFMPQPIDGEVMWTEDSYHCRKLNKAAVPIYIDHDLSLEVGHLGRRAFGLSDLETEEGAAERGAGVPRYLAAGQ